MTIYERTNESYISCLTYPNWEVTHSHIQVLAITIKKVVPYRYQWESCCFMWPSSKFASIQTVFNNKMNPKSWPFENKVKTRKSEKYIKIY